MRALALLLSLTLLAGCGSGGGSSRSADKGEPETPMPSGPPLAQIDPAEPGEPGGLPDDGTPASEAPFAADSAQGAANVLQTYYALIEAGKYTEAWRLREQRAKAKPGDAAEFAKSFERYGEYHAQVGAPSQVQAAAGSLYVEVPVQLYGRLKDGKPFSTAGTVTLRRARGTTGWRIYTSG
jgi:hypothetical protein